MSSAEVTNSTSSPGADEGLSDLETRSRPPSPWNMARMRLIGSMGSRMPVKQELSRCASSVRDVVPKSTALLTTSLSTVQEEDTEEDEEEEEEDEGEQRAPKSVYKDSFYCLNPASLEQLINGVDCLRLEPRPARSDEDEDEHDDEDEEESLNLYKKNIVCIVERPYSSDSLSATDKSSESEDEGPLLQRGPLRPQLGHHQTLGRARPYLNHLEWAGFGGPEQSHHQPGQFFFHHQFEEAGPRFNQPQSHGGFFQSGTGENSTDFDTSAKAILTDQDFSEKIGLCLDRLSDIYADEPQNHQQLQQDGICISGLAPLHLQNFEPSQHQQAPSTGWVAADAPSGQSPGDSEDTILEILGRGGFQAAQLASTPDYGSSGSPSVASSSLACESSSTNWPDSPASVGSYPGSYSATLPPRPDSRGSSGAHSPGSQASNNGLAGPAGLLSSPLGSPGQVANHCYRGHQRPSSSSSSSQSYYDVPSPANYASPLDARLEEVLNESLAAKIPPGGCGSFGFESSETIVNSSAESSEIRLQLVDEVLRDIGTSGAHQQAQPQPSFCEDVQVVPSGFGPASQLVLCGAQYGLGIGSHGGETLLRMVGGAGEPQPRQEQAQPHQQQLPRRSRSLQHQELGFQGGQVTIASPDCFAAPPSRDVEPWLQEGSYGRAPNARSSSCSGERPKSTTTTTSSCKSSSVSSSSGGGIRRVERPIAPLPSLNMPSTGASERLREATDPREVEKAMKSLLKKPIEELAQPDQDGDTMLMCLVGNPQELERKLAYLAPLVERYGACYEGALTQRNTRGEDALYLAATSAPHLPYVAGYLAAAMMQRGVDPGQRIYHSTGETLLHVLSARGDSHGEVIAELLALRGSQGQPVFDPKKQNYHGRTALHVAAEAHGALDPRAGKIASLGVVRLLLRSGADPTVRDSRSGETALHLALASSAEPALVKMLLSADRGAETANLQNSTGNSPVHAACALSTRTSLVRQTELLRQLLDAGGRTSVLNWQGKSPLALVSPERKDAIRRIFHKK